MQLLWSAVLLHECVWQGTLEQLRVTQQCDACVLKEADDGAVDPVYYVFRSAVVVMCLLLLLLLLWPSGSDAP
jgi:hypothetical protein